MVYTLTSASPTKVTSKEESGITVAPIDWLKKCVKCAPLEQSNAWPCRNLTMKSIVAGGLQFS